MNFVRLPLEGVSNSRELGGYFTTDAKVTKFHVFIRSSRLTDLTEKDNNFLKQYGITDIIDLRGNTKIQAHFVSDDKIDKGHFKFYHIPLSTAEMEQFVKEHEMEDGFNLGKGYGFLLDNKIKVKAIFEVLANAKGGVLFHCTAGKDRTGVIAALILGLCNVDEKDIIANYEVTYTYVGDLPFMEPYSINAKKSDSLFIKTFLKILKERYGNAEEYLLSCDIKKEDLEKIKEKFCESYDMR